MTLLADLMCPVCLRSQCHNAEQLYVWLLHFIANNYLIFSHKPDFLELSGQCVHFQSFSKKEEKSFRFENDHRKVSQVSEDRLSYCRLVG